MNNETVIGMLCETQLAGICTMEVFIKEPTATGELCS
jgi:hypothetical protein